MDDILEITDYVTGYGEPDIIRGVSFRIQRHQIACVIGPNGAGKSTLFGGIFGLLKARHGRIRFDGSDVTNLASGELLRRGLSYVPQGRCNFPAMTVTENLEMGAFIRTDAQVRRDIDGVMEKFPVLRNKARVMAGNLSGGEQQILEMGMALLLRPKLLLLDEPSLGLAPRTTGLVFEKIKDINADGTTILIVEQNARRALAISQHAIVLELGQKRFEGTGEEIMQNEQVRRLYLGGGERRRTSRQPEERGG
ncbi:MAG TPA: ABC transporter ATP-binding protein [Methylomirabilota bacterium]|jgi:branched-chain amino acid transport system ATP-binding protein|nr:ABC transporter ATP-binding protein [Methylomirabilota bacterium]